jgi:hypothetical protein
MRYCLACVVNSIKLLQFALVLWNCNHANHTSTLHYGIFTFSSEYKFCLSHLLYFSTSKTIQSVSYYRKGLFYTLFILTIQPPNTGTPPCHCQTPIAYDMSPYPHIHQHRRAHPQYRVARCIFSFENGRQSRCCQRKEKRSK